MNDETTKDILRILDACHYPVTVKEITEFCGVESRAIRERLNRLSDEKVVQKIARPNEKYFSVMRAKGDTKRVRIPVKHIRTIGGVVQLVGRIDLFDLQKIAGIHPFRDNVSAGIQRVRQGAWTKTLAKRLDNKESVMLNNISLYIDAEFVENFDIEESIPEEIVVPYTEYVGDSLKPAWLIDGQQRTWAILRISIMKALGQSMSVPDPFYAPITILVGNFGDDEERKVNQLRRWFVTANETKNLPRNLIAELEARLLLRGAAPESLANPERAADGVIMGMLNTSPESPFLGLIKTETNPRGSISDGSIMSIIRHFRNHLGLTHAIKDNNQVYHLLLDYYWPVRIVWAENWVKPPVSASHDGSRLLHPLGLGSLAFMLEMMAPPEVIYSERKERIKQLIKRFLRIVDDINWADKARLSSYKNPTGEIKRFVTDILRPVYIAQVNEFVPDDDLEEEMAKLPEEFLEALTESISD